jgi:hypothetical protein
MISSRLSAVRQILLPVALSLATLAVSARAADPNSPFVGRWALTTPDGNAGWLGVTAEKGYYDAQIMWEVGSVEPVDAVFISKDTLYVIRLDTVQRKDESGKVVRTHHFPDAITAKIDGDDMSLRLLRPHTDGEGVDNAEFSGKRSPAMPPAPDLSKIKYGNPVSLFNGKSLEGWRLTKPNDVNGWSVNDGILRNNPSQEEGKSHRSYGNLRTDREFEDFNLTLETRVPKYGNSGIFLRGRYEVQVADTYGQPADWHNMGALYSRITPSDTVEKPPGEWQTFDITFCDRHVTVILNGKKIIDNKPVLGCTGGALTSDETQPGPIYLQGDHAGVEYRNIVLKPIVK